MRLVRPLIVLVIAGLLISASACVVVKKDNGRHRGWFKNRKTPHHRQAVKPGKVKVKTVRAKR